MFDRQTIKAEGKKRFQLNYWNCVLAGLVLAFAIGGAYTGTGASATSQGGEEVVSDPETVKVTVTALVSFGSMLGILLKFFIFNPLEVGGHNFFLKNQTDENTSLSELKVGFTSNYTNIVKTMAIRDLITGLFMLLLVVPGIIKIYQYRMVPYLLSENPDMDQEEVRNRSKEIMEGNKWAAFVLDISFFGWYILSGITCGLASIFYVSPYVFATDAELYRTLK